MNPSPNYDELLSLIEQSVTYMPEGMTWKDVRDRILGRASDEQRNALMEFCAWFEED